MDKVDLDTVQVSIKRDQETIIDEVFAHEVPILEAAHFRENVQVINKDLGSLEIPDDADLEYRRLQGKYDRKNMQLVGRIYRDADELARKSGLTMHGDRTRAPSEASIKERRPEKKAADKAGKKAGDKA